MRRIRSCCDTIACGIPSRSRKPDDAFLPFAQRGDDAQPRGVGQRLEDVREVLARGRASARPPILDLRHCGFVAISLYHDIEDCKLFREFFHASRLLHVRFQVEPVSLDELLVPAGALLPGPFLGPEVRAHKAEAHR